MSIDLTKQLFSVGDLVVYTVYGILCTVRGIRHSGGLTGSWVNYEIELWGTTDGSYYVATNASLRAITMAEWEFLQNTKGIS